MLIIGRSDGVDCLIIEVLSSATKRYEGVTCVDFVFVFSPDDTLVADKRATVVSTFQVHNRRLLQK